MSNRLDYGPFTNEPRVHPLVRSSFVFVPSAGMRHAPELLMLELFREVFFSRRYESNSTKELDPTSYPYSLEERAVLGAMRGRQKKTKQSRVAMFYAPAYPCLARGAWMGKNRERVIVNFLFAPIAQALATIADNASRHAAQRELAEVLIQALVGNRTSQDGVVEGCDILSVALEAVPFSTDCDLARRNLMEKTSADVYMDVPSDELSKRVHDDMVALCNLEGRVPRMQWVQLLMTYLRFALPVWLLAQMRITTILHGLLLDAADRGIVSPTETIIKRLTVRNRELLRPTLTPTREIYEKTELYIRHRVELSVLLTAINKVNEGALNHRKLVVRRMGDGFMRVEELLRLAKESAPLIKSSPWFKVIAADSDIKTFLVRESEQFAAWRNPLKKGQGKNIDEFFRVLIRNHGGDESGGFLFVPGRVGRNMAFTVYPGQLLLKTITFLAASKKRQQSGGGGQLVLQDVEDHFAEYGIDFGYSTDVRPRVVRELQALGLLSGSPDAGSSMTVSAPF